MSWSGLTQNRPSGVQAPRRTCVYCLRYFALLEHFCVSPVGDFVTDLPTYVRHYIFANIWRLNQIEENVMKHVNARKVMVLSFTGVAILTALVGCGGSSDSNVNPPTVNPS